jgi:hypothetical protein
VLDFVRQGRSRLSIVLAIGVIVLAVGVLLVRPSHGSAQAPGPGPGLGGGYNDLFAISRGSGDSPTPAPVQSNPEAPLLATPQAPCDTGSRLEPGIDGRVPAGTGANGLWCNMRVVAHQGTSGGFKTLRYIDQQGHECAFYDTALLFPTNAVNAAGPSLGVAVLDMSDPAHPVQTATLSTPPMLTPHESLNLNVKRGLLAAVSGNPSTEPGFVSIYDVHADCRHPVLDSDSPVARLGHESGFSSDGKTFYATSTAYTSITAIDVTDPKNPQAVWQGAIYSHGMSLSDDGNRAYIADSHSGQLLVLDTSQIQARKPNPVVREVSRLTWKSVSIPQNAIPFTEHGHPYLLEFDEYTAGTTGGSSAGAADEVGAGRIIDMADETKPRVIANLRLQVDQPADHHTAVAANDPGTLSPVQGYAAHYCNVPTRVDPKTVACSFIASGLRLFDISNLTAPKEIGYFVSPTTADTENGYNGADYAMSQPVIIPERHEVWYADGGSGFYVLRVDPSVWPAGDSSTAAGGSGVSSVSSGSCSLRHLRFRLHSTGSGPITKARVFVGGRLAFVRRGRNLKSVSVQLTGSGARTIRIVTYDRRGLNRTSIRSVKACVKSRPHTKGRFTNAQHRRRA